MSFVRHLRARQTSLAPELAVRVARQARASAPAAMVTQLLATAIMWQSVEHRPLVIWLLACIVNDIRMLVANHLEVRRLTRGGDPWYLVRNVVHGLLSASAWGALVVVAERWGTDVGTTMSLLIVVGVLCSIVFVGAGSQLHFAIAVIGAVGPALLALAGRVTEPSWFVVLLALFGVVIFVLHRSVHRLVVEHVMATTMNRELVQRLADTMANVDPVTGAMNRTGLVRWLDDHDEGIDEIRVTVAVVNELEGIRWLVGQEAADIVLATVVRRFQVGLPSGVAVSRVGDNQLAVVGPADVDHAVALHETTRTAVVVGHESFTVGLSLASSTHPRDSMSAAINELGNELVWRRSALLPISRERPPSATELELYGEIPAALTDGHIGSWFQPLTDTRTGDVSGWEALARWDHAERGLVPPQTFLPLAYAGGHGGDVTRRMVHDAIRFIAILGDHGHHRAAKVSVNVDATDLTAPLVEHIERLAERYGVSANRLTVEITESTLMHVDHVVLSVMHDLRAHGVRIAIDDFGTGYSSLSHLLDLPVDAIKIDRRFVAGLPEDRRSVALVRALLGLARALNFRTVVEGVETNEQRALLEQLGADRLQGFITAPAMPPEAAIEWLTHSKLAREREPATARAATS